MDSTFVFRITVALMMLGYILPRSYYRRRARRDSAREEPSL